MKYNPGDIVKIFFLSKWRVAVVLENKEMLNFFANQYNLLICGLPGRIEIYYEDEICGKI
jgi:hypothetical protein